jgi:hypothetical protein
MEKMAWSAKVSIPFCNRVLQMCDDYGWDWPMAPSDSMACMGFESARTFSPTIVNAAGSGAVGLIQFMPRTAHGLGTTTMRLMRMTAVDQLDYVEQYFRPYAHRIHGLSDMYMAILLPKYVGADDDAVLFSEGIAYRQNAGLDANTDGKITKREAAARVFAMREEGLRPENVRSDLG